MSDLFKHRQICISASEVNVSYAALLEIYEQKPSLTHTWLVEKGRYFNGFKKKPWMSLFDSTLTFNKRTSGSFLKMSCSVESETMSVEVSVTPKPRVCPVLRTSLCPRMFRSSVHGSSARCGVWSHADLTLYMWEVLSANTTRSLHHWQL